MQLLRNLFPSEPSKRFFLCCFETLKRRSGFSILQSLCKKKSRFGLTTSTRLHLRDSPFSSYGRITRVKKPYFNFIRPGFIQQATSRWSSGSLAASLSRKAGRKLFSGSSGATLSFVGFVLAKKPSILSEPEELESLSSEIRDAFSKFSDKVADKENAKNTPFPKASISISDFTIGILLAKGCNAAVYSAQWKGQLTDVADNDENEERQSEGAVENVIKERTVESRSHELIMSHSETGASAITASALALDTVRPDTQLLRLCQRFSASDLVIKMMFNYSAQSDAFTIWRAMRKEALPALMDLPFDEAIGLKRTKISPHPNIVEMYCAFTDETPLLPKAMSTYPQALPVRLMQDGCGRNMTLFLVMKRYHCSLKDYLKNFEPSTNTSLLIFCQLLEGLVHLRRHKIAHRDLKTDNILVDLAKGMSNPAVAITDFGCCLEGLKLPYTSEEVDRGGNIALMAPEVATAKPGPFSSIDYSKSDLWTLGCMAYEIFGAKNPFYLTEKPPLHPDRYEESELPQLPTGVPPVIKKLIKDILQKDAKLRPSPALAATVCQLLLHAPREFLDGPFTRKEYKNIVQWMFIMSAKTFLQVALKHEERDGLEFQLRYTFCRRIRFLELLDALHYISQASMCK